MLVKKIAMLIAQQDFRDEEYFIPKSVFEQQGFYVSTVGAEKGQAIGTFGGVANTDIVFDDLKINDFDCFVFVGGAGAMRDLNNREVYKIAKQGFSENKLIAAICIAPAILAESGILKGKKATVWSGTMDKTAVKMLEKGGADYQDNPIVIDGNIITANGPPQARKFAETIVNMLQG